MNLSGLPQLQSQSPEAYSPEVASPQAEDACKPFSLALSQSMAVHVERIAGKLGNSRGNITRSALHEKNTSQDRETKTENGGPSKKTAETPKTQNEISQSTDAGVLDESAEIPEDSEKSSADPKELPTVFMFFALSAPVTPPVAEPPGGETECSTPSTPELQTAQETPQTTGSSQAVLQATPGEISNVCQMDCTTQKQNQGRASDKNENMSSQAKESSALPEIMEVANEKQAASHQAIQQNSAGKPPLSPSALPPQGKEGSKAADKKTTLIQKIQATTPEMTGTAVAHSSKTMSSEAKQNEFAALDKQFLPEVMEFSGGEAKNDSKESFSFAPMGNEAKHIPVSQPALFEAAVLQASSPSSDVQTRPSERVERLAHLFSNEVAVMRQFKPDKLEVVLRPDSQTRISLQLKMEQGQVAGVARCEQGDFGLLSSHWADLQRTLEGQGVRMAPLLESGSELSFSQKSFDGSSNFRQQQEKHEAPSNPFETSWSSVRPSRKAALKTAAPNRPVNNQILQTWA